MAITQKLTRLCRDIETAQEILNDAIFAEMAKTADREGIDSICFGMGTTYEHNGVEVQSEALDKLEQLYLDYLHSGGFQALWSADKGWH